LKGVIKIADKVAKAVRVTDSAVLPFANDDKKFDMLPPGHDATSIKPNATEGVGLINNISKNVRAGKAKNCEK
jgi:hypothetical protein